MGQDLNLRRRGRYAPSHRIFYLRDGRGCLLVGRGGGCFTLNHWVDNDFFDNNDLRVR